MSEQRHYLVPETSVSFEELRMMRTTVKSMVDEDGFPITPLSVGFIFESNSG